MLRPGIIGRRRSMVIRLRSCMVRVYPPSPLPLQQRSRAALTWAPVPSTMPAQKRLHSVNRFPSSRHIPPASRGSPSDARMKIPSRPTTPPPPPELAAPVAVAAVAAGAATVATAAPPAAAAAAAAASDPAGAAGAATASASLA